MGFFSKLFKQDVAPAERHRDWRQKTESTPIPKELVVPTVTTPTYEEAESKSPIVINSAPVLESPSAPDAEPVPKETGISQESSDRGKEAVEYLRTMRKPSPYEHLKFYATNTHGKNEDGTERQDILYKFKMRRPPFDRDVDLSIISDTEDPDHIGIAIKGHLIGFVPEQHLPFVNDNWDRLDAVSALDVLGRKGDYDAQVFLRFLKGDIND